MLQTKLLKKKKKKCYELMHRLGHGVVYFGSLRIVLGHSHYLQAVSTKLSCFLPEIHACKYLYLNHVFICIKNPETWKHKTTDCILETPTFPIKCG